VTDLEPGDGTYYGSEWAVFDASVQAKPMSIADVEVTTTSGAIAIVDASKQQRLGQGHVVYIEHGGVVILGPTHFVIRTPHWQLRLNIR
jgi:hypothetical protein